MKTKHHRDILPHLKACLEENGKPITESISGMSHFRWRISVMIQPSVFLIMRNQVQNAAECGWVFAERGIFDKACDHLEMVKDVLVRALGIINEKTMNAMLGLAGIYWGLG